MRWLALFLLFFPLSSRTNSANDFHICFFELNNRTTSKNLITKSIEQVTGKKIGEVTGIDLDKKSVSGSLGNGISVHTYTPNSQREGERGTVKGFKAMIEESKEENKQCDSLVISGHHTGNWYGKLGGLKLKELEDLSCDPKYKDWFKNIKALWLDGCNTVTDNIVNSSKGPSQDAEAARVSEDETADGAYISENEIKALGQAYSLSLDKNTPLSSRYLRAFSNTQIYGFNGAAPEGDQTGNASFILDHLSNLGRALKTEQKYLEQQADIEDLKLGLVALTSDPCDEDRIEAWEKIENSQGLKLEAIENQNYKEAEKLGCDLILAKKVLDDPNDKEAQQALAQKIKDEISDLKKSLNSLSGEEKQQAEVEVEKKEELLNLANAILSANSSDSQKSLKAVELAKELLKQTLDTIIEKDSQLPEGNTKLSLTHLLFNNIYETWETAKNYKSKDSDFFNAVKEKLYSKNFKDSLKERIESNQTSSIRKADYIKFYIDVNNDRPDFIENGINGLVDQSKAIFEGLNSPRQTKKGQLSAVERPRRALALSVTDQLIQYDLLTDVQKTELLESSALFPSDTNDPFNLSVKAKLQASAGEQELFNQIKRGEGRATGLTALTEKYFQSSNTQEILTNYQTMMDELVDDSNDKDAVLNALHAQLNYKTKEDRITISSNLINKVRSEKARALMASYAYHLPVNEKTEVCNLIDDDHNQYTPTIGSPE